MLLKKINLSEWSLNNQPLVKFFLALFIIMGIYCYSHLNQKEDPEFTFKVMIVQVGWPGATEQQMEDQVVDKIEKKLLELPTLDYTQTFVKPGFAQIMISLKESTRGVAVTDSWYQVRKKISDISQNLPQGVQGPFFNDEFGDTYSNIYAFLGDGYSYEDLRRILEDIKREALLVPGVEKIDILGTQSEQISVNISSSKMSSLGLDLQQILNAIQSQNAVNASGVFNTNDSRILIRPTGNFESVADIKALPISINGKIFKLGDVADIKREFINPPQSLIRYDGRPALLLALTLHKDADVIATGKDINQLFSQIKTKLPVGIEEFQVTNQPEVVKDSIHEFTKGLLEAVIIVLAISFLSLGLRTGVIVAISIPLVLAITFVVMYWLNIDLQRISLGALIISLGLLVDDAIIAIEMMVLKLEEGMDRFHAAIFAYTSTAFPMLTGTLITAAGFLPVGFAHSNAGEYVYTLFAVVTISLIVSWFVAVIFTPFLGYHLLPKSLIGQHKSQDEIFNKPFYNKFKTILDLVLCNRRMVVIGTGGIFIFSLICFKLFVAQQFFPSSNRNELMVDMWLPQSASIYDTESNAVGFEKIAKKQDGVLSVTSFIGTGAPRFYLPLNAQLPNVIFAQFLVITKDIKAREQVKQKLTEILLQKFPDTRSRVNRLENGPPVGYPVQFRISGPNANIVHNLTTQVESIMMANPAIRNINNDWGEDIKSLHLVVDQNKAQQIGVSSSDLERQLNTLISGTTMTYYFDKDETIPLVAQLDHSERVNVANLENLMIQTASGKFVPIGQVAKVQFAPETSIKYRRNRVPTITVNADVVDGVQAPDVSNEIYPKLKALEEGLPLGYHIEIGGTLESSQKSQNSINAILPISLIVVLILLMLQLNSFVRTVMVLLTAPLGMIGVTLSLILFNAPFGFVAMLGAIALFGIIMRNSIILIDQIDTDIKGGESQYHAIINSTLRRFRPITLTALAAILGMLPLTRSDFWGPMAVAMMGGLFIATILTLVFLPALYAWVFKVYQE